MIHMAMERTWSNHDASISSLWVDKVAQCVTVEDEYRAQKVRGETRIDPGVYPLGLHRTSSMLAEYIQEYGPEHVGMVQILNLPRHTGVFFHWGNDHNDTAGCPCVGETMATNPRSGAGTVSGSRAAYRRVIFPIVQRLALGEPGYIEIIDRDRPVDLSQRLV